MAIAMLRVVRTIRRPTNWKTILALVASVTAVVRTPRTFTQTWGVWVFAFGVCAALGVYRWHVLSRERRGENRGIDARDRMKLVAGATRPLLFATSVLSACWFVIAPASAYWEQRALAHNDERAYLDAQVAHAVIAAPDDLRQAIRLAAGAFAPADPTCRPAESRRRRDLIHNDAIPDTFRQEMLRADARCEQRSGREVLVAADVLAIYEFPFQLSTAESTPFVDAYFGLHDQAAAIIIGRQASPAMRDDLRRQRALTRDRGFRHAIDLALER